MIAFFFAGCATVDGSGMLSGALLVGLQPSAPVYDLSSAVFGLLLLVIALGAIDPVLRHLRRARLMRTAAAGTHRTPGRPRQVSQA